MNKRSLITLRLLLLVGVVIISKDASAGMDDPEWTTVPEGVTELAFKEPLNISGNGQVVLGEKRGRGVIANLEDMQNGDYTSLKSLLSDGFSGLPDGCVHIKRVNAYGISYDGQFISGSMCLKDGCDTVTRAFVADLFEGNIRLLAGSDYFEEIPDYISANDVSDNGLVAVGEEVYDGNSVALWWTDTTNGELSPVVLNPLAGVDGEGPWTDDGSWANAINAAGTRAVGASYFQEESFDGDGEFSQAVYWDLSGESPVAHFIGSLMANGGLDSGESEANDISRNGNYIVGWAQTGEHSVAPFISYQGQGMMALVSPDASYTQWGEALGVSNNGTAVGYFESDEVVELRLAESSYSSIAFVANPAWGSKTVGDWLTSTGAPAPGANYHYLKATAISEDGKIVVGIADQEGCEVGFIARAGSGSIEPTSYYQTLAASGAIGPQATQVMNNIFNGAHHIPLQLMKGPSRHVWFTTDGGRWDRYNSNSLLTEVGGAVDLFDKQLLVGFGFGLNWIEQNKGAINADLNGQYYLTELSYKPTDLPFIFTLTGSLGHWDVSSTRNYLNAGVPDASYGDTDVNSEMLRLSIHWLDAIKVAGFGITPKIQYSVNHTSVNGYTESGGGFPAAYNKQGSTAQEIRYGLWAARNFFNDKMLFRLRAEAVQRLDRSGPGTSGTVIGLFNFNLPGQQVKQAWVQFGTDFVYSLTQKVNLTASVNTATYGEDPVILGSAGVQVKF